MSVRGLATLLVVGLLGAACSGDDGPAATSVPTTTTFGPDRGDGVLQVDVAVAGAQAEAALLAVEDVGEVLGQPVQVVSDGADVVIGTGPPQPDVVWIAPSGPDADGPLVFRTGAGADLLAQAVVDLVLDDGHAGADVVGESDLADAIDDRLDDDDQAIVVVDAAGPPAEVLAGASAYLVGGSNDGNGAPEGTKAIEPGAEPTGELRGPGAAEAYDAVVIAALAAEAAGTDDPARLAAQVRDVTQGGSTCLAFDECASLDDPDYDGPGGGYALGQDGRPTESVVTVREYAADGRIDPNRTEYRVVTADG